MESKEGSTVTRTIVVNTKEHEVSSKEISYEEVVELAYGPDDEGPNVIYTVTYRRGTGNKPEGSLAPGESTKVKDGMIFDVTRTDKS